MRCSIVLALLLACAPPAFADPEGEGAWFVDVGPAKGLPAGLNHRNVFVDLDGDRWPDAVLHNQRVFKNVPDPAGGRRFVEAPQALGLTVGKRRPDLLLFADLDDDGKADALVGYAGDPKDAKKPDTGDRTRIFLQRRGQFQPLAPRPGAHLGNTLEPFASAAFVDVDRDGRLDLLTGGNYLQGGLPYECSPLRLLRAQGAPGRFTEITDRAGLTLVRQPGRADSRRPLFGLSIADVNGDGRMDILACAYGRQRNLLYLAQPGGRFREVGIPSRFFGDADTSGTYPDWTKRYFKQRYKVDRKDEQPFRANGNTFEAACADVDNDGDIDVFLGEITHGWAGKSSDLSQLLLNQRSGAADVRFRRVAAATRQHANPRRWNQGDLYAGWLDADNDGLLDLLVASGDYPDDQRLRLFRQHPAGTFTDVSKRVGLDWDNCTQVTLADYDRDGDVDILVGNSNMRLPAARRKGRKLRIALFENRIGNRNHWLNVQLRGKGAAAGGSNRAGLGARVTVRCGTWRATREIVGGRGHAGRNDHFEAAFGLGRRSKIDELRIRWPNKERSESVFTDVPVDQFVVAEEGKPTLRVLGPN